MKRRIPPRFFFDAYLEFILCGREELYKVPPTLKLIAPCAGWSREGVFLTDTSGSTYLVDTLCQCSKIASFEVSPAFEGKRFYQSQETGYVGYMDTGFQKKLEARYRRGDRFYMGLAIVQTEGGKLWIIDTLGNYVHGPWTGGNDPVAKEMNYLDYDCGGRFFDRRTRTLGSVCYLYIDYWGYNKGSCLVKADGKYCLIGDKEEVIFEFPAEVEVSVYLGHSLWKQACFYNGGDVIGCFDKGKLVYFRKDGSILWKEK